MLKKIIEKKLIDLIIFFIAVGSFLLLMYYGSGWSKLVQLYKTNQHPPVVVFNNQSGKIGVWFFGKALTIGVSRQGLYLSNSFNWFNNVPPLLIPWDAVTHVRPDDKILKREAYQLDIGTPTITTLTLPKAALLSAETILEAK